ncbi:MAG: hypothetical protein LBV12_09010 [Puniceicoccales bacterium]|nr:hypothetical protein [Puniceicoccales bacterium]
MKKSGESRFFYACLNQEELDFFRKLNIVLLMIKSISKIGNSQGLIFDANFMELAHLKLGDQLNVSVHEGGAIILTPIKSTPTEEEISASINHVMKHYSKTMRRLA